MTYTVNFDNVKSHYVNVEIEFSSQGKDYVDFKVPVWTPGSYKVREFSKAFENVRVEDLEISRRDKNTWRIETKGKEQVKLSYDVYCFTISVRHSYVDQFYAFLHGVSAFGYLDGFENEQIVLKINPLDEWKNVEVALPQTKAPGYVYTCTNYDLLADSPIAVGNFDSDTYETKGVPHKIVMIGEGNYNLSKFTKDVKRITDWQADMIGEHPSNQYIHFIYNVNSGGGGLEHANSHTSMINRWAYTNKGRYRSFLGLIAHEYFHLWNVKRIRPLELGPFDYDKEVYTDMLWIAEGITSYYDDLTMYKLGNYSEKEYLNILKSNISRLENTAGKDVMSLAESSRLAWIKSYLPNEESPNVSVSYYNKGMVVALLLDLEIRKSSNKCLDDVMTELYKNYYKNGNKGLTHAQFESVVNKVAGRDLSEFFKTSVYSTDNLDYSVFQSFGLELSIKPSSKSYSGIKSAGHVISNIVKNSPAVFAGLSVNDEILGLNGWKINTPIEKELEKLKVGSKAKILFSRDQKILETELTITKNPNVGVALTKIDEDNKELKRWLKR